MKLVRQSSDTLVLSHRPLLLCVALGLAGVMVLGLGVWNALTGDWLKTGVAVLAGAGLVAPAVWFGTEQTDITFDGPSGTCTIATRRLTGEQHEIYPLSQIESAVVETIKGPIDTGGSHRIALVLNPGGAGSQMPLTKGYAGGRWAQALSQRINTWLESHAPHA